MKDPDYISDKTSTKVSLVASCFKVIKVKNGATRDTDRFRVSMREYARGKFVGWRVIRHELKRKDFAKFMLRNRPDMEYIPDIKSY